MVPGANHLVGFLKLSHAALVTIAPRGSRPNSLPADPTDPEVQRNIGITQPVLWHK